MKTLAESKELPLSELYRIKASYDRKSSICQHEINRRAKIQSPLTNNKEA